MLGGMQVNCHVQYRDYEQSINFWVQRQKNPLQVILEDTALYYLRNNHNKLAVQQLLVGLLVAIKTMAYYPKTLINNCCF